MARSRGAATKLNRFLLAERNKLIDRSGYWLFQTVLMLLSSMYQKLFCVGYTTTLHELIRDCLLAIEKLRKTYFVSTSQATWGWHYNTNNNSTIWFSSRTGTSYHPLLKEHYIVDDKPECTIVKFNTRTATTYHHSLQLFDNLQINILVD